MTRFALPLLFVVASLTISPPGLAQAAPPPPPNRTSAQHPAHSSPKPGDRDCVRSTGSLIPAKPGRCLPVAGRAYSQEDLRRTGATTTADALRMLDPSIH